MRYVGWLALVAALWATAPLEAQTRRVRIQIGDRVMYSRMGPGPLPGFGAGTGLEAPPPVLPSAPEGAPEAAETWQPPEAVSAHVLPPVPAEDTVASNPVDLAEDTGEAGEDPGPVPAEMRQILANIYGVTDEDTVQAAWWWASRDGDDLPIATRTGNGMHRLMVARLAEGEAVAGEYTGEPHPEGLQGALFTVNGVTVRAAPYGATVGTLANGEAVTILGRDENNWYRIRGSSGVTGWSSGFWMRFQ